MSGEFIPVQLEVGVYYRKQLVKRYQLAPGETLTFGRTSLAALLHVPPDQLDSISHQHCTLWFEETDKNFYIRDHSTHGILLREMLEDSAAGGREFHLSHSKHPIKKHVWVRLRNEDARGQPDDIALEILNPQYVGTKALTTFSPWKTLLNLLQTYRAVHLLGMSGVGKTHLARYLIEPVGTRWQQDRDRYLGEQTLCAWLDCRTIEEVEDRELWYAVAYQMALALLSAVHEAHLYDLANQVDAILQHFAKEVKQHPSQMLGVFGRVFNLLIHTHNYRILFIFDNCDPVVKDLDPAMLYQIVTLQRHWPSYQDKIHLLILTRRPLNVLREDLQDERVRHFLSAFSQSTLLLRGADQENFPRLWRDITQGAIALTDEQQALLFQWSGGHPGLLEDIYTDLSAPPWVNQSDRWARYPDSIDWQTRPPRHCDALWRSLTPPEQYALRSHIHGRPLSDSLRDTFQQLGLLNPRGDIFSQLFQTAIQEFQQRQRRGLYFDPLNRSILLDGEPVSLKRDDTVPLEILIYLYQHANQLCSYEQIVRDVYKIDRPDKDLIKAMMRAVSRLRQLIHDPDQNYLVNKARQGYILQYSD